MQPREEKSPVQFHSADARGRDHHAKNRSQTIFGSGFALIFNVCCLPTLHLLCYNNPYASVAELADALDLGSSAFRRAGSIPVARTNSEPGSWDASCEPFCLHKSEAERCEVCYNRR